MTLIIIAATVITAAAPCAQRVATLCQGVCRTQVIPRCALCLTHRSLPLLLLLLLLSILTTIAATVTPAITSIDVVLWLAQGSTATAQASGGGRP